MLVYESEQSRGLRIKNLQADLVVVGGGMSGTCCAITAARAGVRVILVQDRPVLGGNGSSEVRLWTLGATSHMQNNNRWAREGGVIDEILVENLYRNPEGNALILDTVLLEKVSEEPNITLLLNAAVYAADKSDRDEITQATAFCAQNSTQYLLSAPLFCDASGDGVLAFLSGAPFRMGAESREEFGEKFAPSQEYGELLGHSLYFYSKDTGKPVRFVPPSYALIDIEGSIPRYRSFDVGTHGCRLWWLEWGGRLDTVHDTEAIKWELWRVVYGVWNYIKNSGKFPEAANLTLEWVGQIPGKRESRRFEGDYLLRQQDIVEQTSFPDVVAFGGWSIDLHPADGIFSEKPGCNQWHSKGIYGIPYRSFYSRSVPNLFLAGRIISATHVAFGSSRVMATCAHGGQAVGMAASLCVRHQCLPRDIGQVDKMAELQRELQRMGQHLPALHLEDADDLAAKAALSTSSRTRLQALSPDGPLVPLCHSWGMLLPAAPGPMPDITLLLDVDDPGATLCAELRISGRPDSHTPDVTLGKKEILLVPGPAQSVCLDFDADIDVHRYVFICLKHNEHVSFRSSEQRLTGVLAVHHQFDKASGHYDTQSPPHDIGVDTFEIWKPNRRPDGRNMALQLGGALDLFGAENLVNGLQRPSCSPNAWVADLADPQPTLTLAWQEKQTVGRIELFFDTDFDHPMESVLMGHPETTMPFCVSQYRLRDTVGRVLAECTNNHQTRRTILLNPPIVTDQLILEIDHPGPNTPAALFEIRVYAPEAERGGR